MQLDHGVRSRVMRLWTRMGLVLVISGATTGRPAARVGVAEGADAAATVVDREAAPADSRAEELLARRRDRLRTVQPAPRRKWVEFLATLENRGFDPFITFQLKDLRLGLGQISRASRFTPAIRYERPRLRGSELSLRVSGAYSVLGYQVYDLLLGRFDEPAPYRFFGAGYLGAPFEFDRRSQKPNQDFLYLNLRYRNFPHESFYGLGMDSLEENRTEYRLEETASGLVAGYQPFRWLGVLAGTAYLAMNVGPGSGESLPDAEDLYEETGVPGVTQQSDYLAFEAGLYLGYLGDPNLPAGLAGLRFARFDADGEPFDFNRYSIDLRGYLPLGSRQRVLASRLYASLDQADPGSEVPFYLMQSLGGNESLRGYPEFRFRDRNLLYLSFEYRWEAAPAVELALFYDTGKVFEDDSDLRFDGLKQSVGGGIRFKSHRRVLFRIDIGHSREGTLFHFRFAPAF